MTQKSKLYVKILWAKPTPLLLTWSNRYPLHINERYDFDWTPDWNVSCRIFKKSLKILKNILKVNTSVRILTKELLFFVGIFNQSLTGCQYWFIWHSPVTLILIWKNGGNATNLSKSFPDQMNSLIDRFSN